jgi:hypothetical protein
VVYFNYKTYFPDGAVMDILKDSSIPKEEMVGHEQSNGTLLTSLYS